MVVAGFSQGGALAYRLGLKPAGLTEGSEGRLGGLVALSTFLRPQMIDPRAGATTVEVADVVKATPVLICHGDVDDRIPGGAAGAAQVAETLTSAGMYAPPLPLRAAARCCDETLDLDCSPQPRHSRAFLLLRSPLPSTDPAGENERGLDV